MDEYDNEYGDEHDDKYLYVGNNGEPVDIRESCWEVSKKSSRRWGAPISHGKTLEDAIRGTAEKTIEKTDIVISNIKSKVTVHAFGSGQALCGYGRNLLLSQWEIGHEWVYEEDAIGKVSCTSCLINILSKQSSEERNDG
jgi:hypothetical protein